MVRARRVNQESRILNLIVEPRFDLRIIKKSLRNIY